MQKVITLTNHLGITDREAMFTEKEYPQLSKYLDEGYNVIQAIPISIPGDIKYSITFILEKLEKDSNEAAKPLRF